MALGPCAARSYSELARNAAALAGWLRGIKPRRKTPIAIVSENRVEVIETLFACWWLGHPVAPIDPSLPREDLAARLAHSEAEACFASPRAATAAMAAAGENVRHFVEYGGPSYASALAAEPLGPPRPRSAADTAWLSFSDREPGQPPRAAMLSFQALMSMATSMLAELETIKPRDAQIHAMPWTGASGFTLLPTLARGGLNVMPETGAFDAAEFFENAERWRRASTLVSASHLRALLASEAEMEQTSFRTVAVAGLDVSRPLIERALERFGPRLARLYGHSAFPIGLTRLNSHDVSARSEASWADRLRSVGRPFLATQISIRSDHGREELAPGETGWIYARGLHGMRGYWRDRRSRVSNHGAEWRHLGLRGAMDDRGYLSVLGPAAHLLAGPHGEAVAPETIEAALIDQGEALDAGVTRSPVAPDAARAPKKGAQRSGAQRKSGGGEEIVVFLQKDRRASAPALLDAGYAGSLPIAARYEVDALPRSASGRLRRDTLTRWARERAHCA